MKLKSLTARLAALLCACGFAFSAWAETQVGTWAALRTAAISGGEIVLSGDITDIPVYGESIELDNEQSVVLDLAGHTISVPADWFSSGFISIGDGVTFVIKGGGMIDASSRAEDDSFTLIDNYGTLTIKSGVTIKANAEAYAYALSCGDDGTTIVEDGVVLEGLVWPDGFTFAADEKTVSGKHTVSGGNVVVESSASDPVVADSVVAKIGDTEYTSLAAAISDVPANGTETTIVMQADTVLDAMVTIAAGKNVKLDLNGRSITTATQSNGNHYYAFDNCGTFVVVDSATGGNITSRGVYNHGVMTLNGGTIDACDGNGGYAINMVKGSGTTSFVMNGGLVIASNEDDHLGMNGGYDPTAMKVGANCTAVLNGGAVSNVCDFTYAIEVSGTLRVTNTALVDGAHGAIYLLSGASVIVEGGQLVCSGVSGQSDHTIYLSGNASLSISGGTLTHSAVSADGLVVCVSGSTAGSSVTISGGTFTQHGNDSCISKAVWGGAATFAVSGGTYNKDFPDSYLVEGATKTNNGDGTWTVLPPVSPVAQIVRNDEVFAQYETLAAAFGAAQGGDTVELLSDVTWDGSNEQSKNYTITVTGPVTFDGKGHTVSAPSGSMPKEIVAALTFGDTSWTQVNDYVYTVTNATFSGFSGLSHGVLRCQGVTANVIGCTFTDNASSPGWGVVSSSHANLNVKECVFSGTTSGKCIDFGSNGNNANDITLFVDNCRFNNNQLDGSGVIYVAGSIAAATIGDCSFSGNAVASDGAAVVYCSSTTEVTGCLFMNNTVTVSGSGKKCGVLALGSGATNSVFTENAFVDNTTTYEGGSKATVYVGATGVDLADNYWGDGAAPEIGDGSDIYIASGKSATYDTYASQYAVVGNGVTVTRYVPPVAQIGETKYPSLADAIAAVPTDGDTATTITMLANVTETSKITVAKTQNVVLELNGKTISATASGSSWRLIENRGTLTIKDSVGGGKITANGTVSSGELATIYNIGGTLNLVSGTIEYTGNYYISYAVSNSSNAWGQNDDKETVFNMTGGTISCPHGDQALRVYQNCADTTTPYSHNRVTISGGTILDTGIFVDTYIYKPAENTTGEGISTTIVIEEGATVNGLIDLKLRHPFHTSLTINGGTFGNSKLRVRKFSEWNSAIAEPTDPVVVISGGAWLFDSSANSAFNVSGGWTTTSSWTSYKPYKVTGGVFNVDLNNYAGIVFEEGKTGVDNTDTETKDAYPYTVGVAGPLTFTYNDFAAALVAGEGTFDGLSETYADYAKDENGRLIVAWSPKSGCRTIAGGNHQYAGCDHVTEATYETPNRVNGGCAQYQITSSMVAGDISISNVSFIYDNVGDQQDGSFWYDANGWSGTGASGLPGELQLENHGNIAIDNCSFDGVCLTPYQDGASTAYGLTVTDSDFLNNAKSGLRGIDSKTVTVSGCTFTNCDKGVDFVSNTNRSDSDITLTDNVFDNVKTPFKLRTITQKVNVVGEDTLVRNSPSGAALFSYDTAEVDVSQYLSISAGTYDYDVDGYTAEGYASIDNGNGTWTVGVAVTYVAQIGETQYETLQAAFDAVADGETITLLTDVTQDDGILFNHEGVSAKLDLNEKTLTVNKGSNVNSRAIRIDNGTLEVYNGTIVAVGAGTTSSNGTGCYGAFRVEANGVLNAHDLSLSNARPWGLNVKVLGGEATLTRVTITSSYGGGIEVTEVELGTHSKLGIATLTDCTFTQTGYYDHCSTCLSVSGGSELTINSGSYTSDNYALYVFSSGGVINVNGGTFSGNKNGVAIKAAIDTTTYAQYGGGLSIAGGDFTGGYEITIPAYMTVTGGRYSVDPAAYVPANYSTALVDGKYVIVDAVAKIGNKYYATLDAAYDAAAEGETIHLLADITYGTDKVVDVWGKAVNLDLGGFTLETKSEVDINAANAGYKAAAICYSIGGNVVKQVTVSNGTIITAYGAGIYADDPGLELTLSGLTIRAATVGTQTTKEYSSTVRITYGSKVIINDGSFTGPNAIAVSNSGGRYEITGGEFVGDLYISDYHSTEHAQEIVISGGYFSTKVPANYIVEDKLCTTKADFDGFYTIVPAKTVTFTNGDTTLEVTLPSNFSYPEGDPVDRVLEKPTYESSNTTFVGWKDAQNNTWAKIPAGTDEDLVLTATWESARVVEVTTVEEKTPTVKVTESWVTENNIQTEGKSEDQIVAAIRETLETTDTNDLPKWVNYVLGQEDTTKSAAIVAAKDSVEETKAELDMTFNVPAVDTGFDVKYRVDQVVGETVTEGAVNSVAEIDLKAATEGGSGSAYFQVKAVLTPKGSTDSTKDVVVDVQKTVGVVKVDSAAEWTIVAVPWESLADGEIKEIKASELIHLGNRSNGDELRVYVYKNGTGTYQTYVLEDGEWTGDAAQFTATEQANQQEETPVAATGVTIPRGAGVWMKRVDTSAPIYLLGQKPTSTETVETTLEKPGSEAAEGTKAWNLVASPNLQDVDVATLLNGRESTDKIIVPTAGAPKNYTYENGQWGYDGGEVVETEVTMPNGVKIKGFKPVRVTGDTKISGTTGFWYLNGDKNSTGKKINW